MLVYNIGMKILDFPIVRQSSIDSCSCACVESCLCYFGFDYRENQIRNVMGIGAHPQEIHPKKMIKALNHFGLKTKYEKLTINDLVGYIDKDMPVILNIQAWSTSKHPDWNTDLNGHYAVAIGYDNKKKMIIFSDPASFYKTYLFYGELEKRWHDGDSKEPDYSNMGIVVYGKSAKYKSDKIIHME